MYAWLAKARAKVRTPAAALTEKPRRKLKTPSRRQDHGEHLVPLGSARTARPGGDAVVIAWSHQVELACRASDRLAAEGLSVRVLDLRSLVPLDLTAIAEAVDSCGRVVVAEESPQTGGFGGEVVATVVEESFWSLEAPVVRVSGFDVPYPVGMVEDRYIPDEDRIAAAVRRVLDVA